jgi:hypothetical protein
VEVGRAGCRAEAGDEKRFEHIRIQSNRKAVLDLFYRFSFRSKRARGMLIESELIISGGCSANSLDDTATLVQL